MRPAAVPSPATLGLTRPHAAQDIEQLGWKNPESVDLLWTLAAVGDPDLALNNLIRIYEQAPELDDAVRSNETLRVRLFALLGASTAFGDHLAAHPELWRELEKPLPQSEEMLQSLLGAVDAEPADFADDIDRPDPARKDLSAPGTYRAGEGEHKQALRTTYRTLMMRIAACDVAGTFHSRKGQTKLQPEVGFRQITALTTALADAALTASLACAVRTIYGDEPLSLIHI